MLPTQKPLATSYAAHGVFCLVPSGAGSGSLIVASEAWGASVGSWASLGSSSEISHGSCFDSRQGLQGFG